MSSRITLFPLIGGIVLSFLLPGIGLAQDAEDTKWGAYEHFPRKELRRAMDRMDETPTRIRPEGEKGAVPAPPRPEGKEKLIDLAKRKKELPRVGHKVKVVDELVKVYEKSVSGYVKFDTLYFTVFLEDSAETKGLLLELRDELEARKEKDNEENPEQAAAERLDILGKPVLIEIYGAVDRPTLWGSAKGPVQPELLVITAQRVDRPWDYYQKRLKDMDD